MTSDPLLCLVNLENLSMNSKFIPEDGFVSSTEDTLSKNEIVNFKLVYITRAALDKLNNNAEAVMSKARSAPAYYIISNNSKDLRAAMHEFVDRMLDAVENNHERK